MSTTLAQQFRGLLRKVRKERAGKKHRIEVPDLPGAVVWAYGSQSDPNRFRPLSNDDLTWHPPGAKIDLAPDAQVLVLPCASRHRILPWSLMYDAHVANLTLEGRPVAIAACGRCSTGMAFDPVVRGERLTFKACGMRNGGALLQDDQTLSYWSFFAGEAVSGPLKGTRIVPLPLWQTNWGQCVTEYPTALLGMSAANRHKVVSLRAPELPHRAVTTLERPLDARLPKNALVLGVWTDSATRCYPLSILDRAGTCLNDSIAGEEVVLFHRIDGWAAIAYSRRVEGQVLEFRSTSGRIQDATTGSVWSFDGKALSGPLAGQQLAFVPSAVQEWYIWAAHHPRTEIATI